MKSISELINGLEGDSWERLCQQCYKIKYSNDNYREIPAISGGDCGIEGFTNSGIVNQCYYPQREYDDIEYYNHLRDKMTEDINKLINLNNKKRLIKLGVPIIKEWHFLIPLFRDKKILEHAKSKTDMVRNLVNSNSSFNYISKDFDIIVQDAENLAPQIYRIYISETLSQKIDFSLNDDDFDWRKCPSEKIDNINQKICAIIKSDDEDLIKELVSRYAKAYLKGIEVMNMLSESFKELYADLQVIINSYKKRVKNKTEFNPNSNDNYNIFMNIIDEFRNEIETKFHNFHEASIDELCYDLIGTWLADCSLRFK